MFTGPSRDYTSFGENDQSGGFVYIDASFPRRPGDRAFFLSPLMTATGLLEIDLVFKLYLIEYSLNR